MLAILATLALMLLVELGGSFAAVYTTILVPEKLPLNWLSVALLKLEHH